MSAAAEMTSKRSSNGKPKTKPDAVGIKICGITRVEDAEAAIAAGAAMLGLNFYAPSPRCVSLERAQQIAHAVAGRVPLAGVFVNMDVAELLRIARAVPLDAVQLHGDESAEVASVIAKDFPVIRALRADAGLTPARAAEYAFCQVLLIDTPTPRHGGSGKAFDWSAVDWAGLRRAAPQAKLLLAGGLDASNVARAISVVRPDAVDVCSGVESERGIKGAQKMREFVAAVRTTESEER